MSTSLVDIIKECDMLFSQHPLWKRLEGSPFKNDIPAIAANMIVDAIVKERNRCANLASKWITEGGECDWCSLQELADAIRYGGEK